MKKRFGVSVLIFLLTMTFGLTAFADEGTGNILPRGQYIKTCVDYEPNYTTMDYTYTYVGSVSGDNTNGSSPLQINYVYETSGTSSASISGYGSATAEAGIILSKMKAELKVEFTGTRSWTRGTASGATYSVSPGKFEVLNVYIPAAKTEGRLKYKVYMIGYPNNVFYEYKTLGTSYAPQKNSVHYQVVKSSRSAIEVPSGMTVYTKEGRHISE